MLLAESSHVPVFTLIDTPGAWAGPARGAWPVGAIARNLFEMSRLQVPIVATVIGEGGSGGALALGVADRVLMLENAVYSVITAEGAPRFYGKTVKSMEMRERAASALRITSPELHDLKVIDEIIPEPVGGAHTNHEATAAALQESSSGTSRTCDDTSRTSSSGGAERSFFVWDSGLSEDGGCEMWDVR
jgi:acetyl-CoA carboxylase carboxyl transferase subunit alpha